MAKRGLGWDKQFMQSNPQGLAKAPSLLPPLFSPFSVTPVAALPTHDLPALFLTPQGLQPPACGPIEDLGLSISCFCVNFLSVQCWLGQESGWKGMRVLELVHSRVYLPCLGDSSGPYYPGKGRLDVLATALLTSRFCQKRSATHCPK